ncbi:MAG: hypothetical protein HY959_07590 [Ignavibacteriae bacterium]|nr:hypothetical protein [Ignavibacteriota bacterium]
MSKHIKAVKQAAKPEALKNEYFAGIFLISLATLLLEFSMTRVLSVSLWYHFAFMIISVALLGFGVSGIVFTMSKKLKGIKTDKLLALLSMCFGISVIAGFLVINLIPFDPFSLFSDSMQFLYMPVYYLLITIPFFFAGLIISILLSKFKKDVSKLYFYDLLGAGLSCFAFVLLMPSFGGNGIMTFIAAFGFIASMIFGFKNHKVIAVISFVLMGIGFSFLIDRDNRLPIRVTENKIFGNYIKSRPDLNVFSGWNTISKIDVLKEEEPSSDGYDIQMAFIDEGNASTNIPNVKKFPLLNKPADASNLAFACGKDSIDRVFVLGSGGGGEILVSLYHNANEVIGVEINGLLNDLISNKLTYWTGPLIKNNKQVKLITDDARSVIRSDKILNDVIISAHTISSSAVSSGAMSMVENYIMTKEAVKDYLTHLKNDGVIYISRPETQVPKLISTFKLAGKELYGKDDKRNFIVFKRPLNSFEESKSFMAGVVYKKNGFNDIDVMNMRYEASNLNLDIDYDPMANQEGMYRDLIESNDIENLIKGKPNLIPATDDKPFFDDNFGFGNFNWSDIREIYSQNDKAILALKDKPVAEVTLLTLLFQILFVSLLLLIVPFVFMKKETENRFEKKYLVYFALLGLGYIMLQVSMIQKFTLFLGQPVYTMLTVISTMLVASGIGSRYSGKIDAKKDKNKITAVFIIIGVYAILLGLLSPLLFSALSGSGIFFRIIVSVVLIFPLGFFMGMPFPLGLSLIGDTESNYIPFAWAVNGFFSVIGTVITMILAMIIGFKFIFIITGILYLTALYFLTLRLKRIYLY